MAKVKMQYKTGVMKDPRTKEIIADRRSAHIVNVRIYNLDELVRFALDNNYIEGAKYELAKGIVKGAIEAERALVLAGNAVAIDGWVKYAPRLKGSVKANVRALSAKDNALVMGISALKELKLSLDTFSWQLVDEGFKPTPDPDPIEFDFAQTEGMNEGQVNETADTLLHVSEGCEMPVWGEGDSITLTGRDQTWTMPTPVVDTESMTYGFQIPQDVGGTLEESDPCEFTIRSAGRTGTLAAIWKH